MTGLAVPLLVLLCYFQFSRLVVPTDRNRFLAVNARAMRLPPGLSEICFIETNKAVLGIHGNFKENDAEG
jgi:hypothetical protein